MLQTVLRNGGRRFSGTVRYLARGAQDSHFKSTKSRWEALNSLASEADLDLLKRNDFKGIRGRENTVEIQSSQPEIGLAKLQEHYQKNFRIPADTILDVVLRLEANEEGVTKSLKSASARWLPLLIGSCGLQMSHLDVKSRSAILDRLWQQINRLEMPIDIESFNTRLRVFLENEIPFDANKELASIQEQRGLVPNQKTFQLLLEQLARTGDPDRCKEMVYKMANQGCIIDADCNASLVYCFTLRGFQKKVESLIESSATKFGQGAWIQAQGACALAATVRGDMDLLRSVLRRSVDQEKQLLLPYTTSFDIIWQLAKNSGKQYGFSRNIQLIEQIMQHMNRNRGYFRYLGREVERHISQEYYYTAVALLDNVAKMSEYMLKQQKSMYVRQVMARMARQMIRSRVPMDTVKDIANRISANFKSPQIIQHELLYGLLTFREFSMDERIDRVAAMLDTVDPRRERTHLILPLLTAEESIEERLKTLFRCGNIGYKNIDELDMSCLISLLLQPLYEKNRPRANLSRLDVIVRILKSFGVPETSIWHLIHKWYKIRERDIETDPKEEERTDVPGILQLRGWLKATYSPIFENKATAKQSQPKVKASLEKLTSIVESGDSTRAWNYVKQYGWPEETNFAKIAPAFLEIMLENEDWTAIKDFLVSVSGCCPSTEDSPITNINVLTILRLYAKEETNEFSIRALTDLCFELKRLFPHTLTTQQSFYGAQAEFHTLINTVFGCMKKSRGGVTVEKVDECIDLLRTLVKLEFVHIFATETISVTVVSNVLRVLGWDEAVNTWMKFQTGLNCSNAVIELFRSATHEWNDQTSNVRLQYVIHKAQSFITASRVHLLYVAVLLSLKRQTQAEDYFQKHANAIKAHDCPSVLKLWMVLKFKSIDEDFVLRFMDLCLKYTDLNASDNDTKLIKADVLRVCKLKNLAPLALRLYDRFKSHKVYFDATEKLRLYELVEKHSQLARKWIFSPDGLLRITQDHPIIHGTEMWRIEKDLVTEIAELNQQDAGK